MQSDKFVYSYNGVNYFYEKDYEEDNVKIFHFIKSDSIRLDSFPLSPYSHATYEIFCRWVDMGMPSREQMGGHHHSDHEKYYIKWLNNQIDKMLVEEMTDAL
jgi:hypothetical protein